MTRSRLLLAIILLTVAVLCVSLWVGEGPLWRLVMLKQETFQYAADATPHPLPNSELRGWTQRSRWAGKVLRDVAYYVESGFRAFDIDYRRGWTAWEPVGKVRSQSYYIFNAEGGNNGQVPIEGPPWLWGVTDQTEPTAPWWGEEKAK